MQLNDEGFTLCTIRFIMMYDLHQHVMQHETVGILFTESLVQTVVLHGKIHKLVIVVKTEKNKTHFHDNNICDSYRFCICLIYEL